jgi:ArsR family metal-binding transcriptional regulator
MLYGMEAGCMDQTTVRAPGYCFTLVNIDCLRSSTHFNVVMDLASSIEALLPHLAAALPGCTYLHGSGVINRMDDGHIVAIYPQQITVTDVLDLASATRICRAYYQKILDVQANRETITPIYEKRLSITVLDIFRALPGTNCGQCAEPTCMAFAARVLRREVPLSACGPATPASENQKLLKPLPQLRANGYEVPASWGL